MRSIEARTLACERAVPGSGRPQVITIMGGLTADAPTHAEAGGLRWTRDAGEGFAAFKARCLAAATAAGEEFVVLGGLPYNETETDDGR